MGSETEVNTKALVPKDSLLIAKDRECVFRMKCRHCLGAIGAWLDERDVYGFICVG